MMVWQIVKSLSGSLQREIPKPLSLQPRRVRGSTHWQVFATTQKRDGSLCVSLCVLENSNSTQTFTQLKMFQSFDFPLKFMYFQ